VCWSFGVAGWGGIRVAACHTDITDITQTNPKTDNWAKTGDRLKELHL